MPLGGIIPATIFLFSLFEISQAETPRTVPKGRNTKQHSGIGAKTMDRIPRINPSGLAEFPRLE
jgi:hypothetical protein